MIRHAPFWFDRHPRSRRPAYPKFRGELRSNVVVVGGGLTGCACAWSFASAGVSCVVLESEHVGRRTTAGASGLVREDFDASFQETASAHGLRSARLIWQGLRRASLDFAAAIRRLGLRCDLAPQDLLRIAARQGSEDKRLEREYRVRREAGLDHSWLNAVAVRRETALENHVAIRTRGAVVDPYRACIGLAAAAVDRGAAVFEQSGVRRIRAGRKAVEVVTARGRITADAVVIAAGAGLQDLRALRRHLRPERGYAVVTEPLPAPVRRELGERRAALRDSVQPPHFLRWLKEDRVLFAGADQAPVADRSREKVLRQRTGQLMYELSVLYPAISGAQPDSAWDFDHDGTVDGLPFIGTHRNFPRHLFALGHGRHGAATSWLAARVLLRLYLDEMVKGDDLFGFSRVLGG